MKGDQTKKILVKCSTKRKRHFRGKYFSSEITDILRAWLVNHRSHPYPTEMETRMLRSKTGLTEKQLRIWFVNSRQVSPSAYVNVSLV